MPTVEVLAEMQWNGMYADEAELNNYDLHFIIIYVVIAGIIIAGIIITIVLSKKNK